MSMQEIVVMMHNGEYGRVIASLEHEVKDTSHPASERVEYCRWLAECNSKLDAQDESGNWYIEGVRIILSEPVDPRTKAKMALPLCDRALEAYEKGGGPADVLVAARLKQYLIGLLKA